MMMIAETNRKKDTKSRDYGLTERKQQGARERKIECLAKREREA